ncbi:acyl-CoA carboxylase subunit epsilon [Streptomyces sp. B-S-A8]|uniref:Acyl-CoA carboxylase subunit epsilon n=1 Tax=Streptomyces solicavernae TaxID=3043614 RepID=A0ABT6S2B4_9ACTN|nr:acyl-CoA carboxylase subunit epsilon [Streptomyces sp. B-S-A8]MDI3390594.1 acyl-CoA carboxylase subunit epsilon [Streptomyces sp. B-S-A8]
MDRVESKDALLRIERGQATEEELAAVAVTLFSLAAAQNESQAADDGGRSVARWSRRERARAYQAPHSWR